MVYIREAVNEAIRTYKTVIRLFWKNLWMRERYCITSQVVMDNIIRIDALEQITRTILSKWITGLSSRKENWIVEESKMAN